MKRTFKAFEKHQFVLGAFAISTMLTASLHHIVDQDFYRGPSDENQGYTLSISHIDLDPNNRVLDHLDGIYLRLKVETSKGVETVDYFKDRPLYLNKGERLDLGINIPIQPRWVDNDQFKFKIELNQPKGLLSDFTVVRCAFVSKNISEYDRNYTCTLPKGSLKEIRQTTQKTADHKNSASDLSAEPDPTPLMTYRLFKNTKSPSTIAGR